MGPGLFQVDGKRRSWIGYDKISCSFYVDSKNVCNPDICIIRHPYIHCISTTIYRYC